MKKIIQFTGIALLAIFITACENPFWPDINFGTDPETPVFDKQPNGNEDLEGLEGVYYFKDTEEPHDLSVIATVNDGGTLTYQWYSYPAGASELATAIENATYDTYTPPVDVEGETYCYVVVTNTLNGKTATAVSNHVKVTVMTYRPDWLHEVAITITAPKKGDTPDINPIIVENTKGMTLGSVVWSSAEGIITAPFVPSTVYTVEINLEAPDDILFAPAHFMTIPKINGIVIPLEDLTETSDRKKLTLILTFAATEAKGVKKLEIIHQPRLTYTHGDTLDLSELKIKLEYDDDTDEELDYADFDSIISVSLLSNTVSNSTVLSHTNHNTQKIAISCEGINGTITEYTDALTVNKAVILGAAIGVTAPVTGVVPNATASGGTSNFSVSNVTWTPNETPFRGSTAYTASVTLTAEDDYTFTGGLTDARINGFAVSASPNNGSTATLSYAFPDTTAATVDSLTVVNQPQLEYTHNTQLDLSGLTIKINYSDSTSSDDIHFANFPAGITVSFEHGLVLDRSTHNNQSITITHTDSGKTGTTNIIVINEVSITGTVNIAIDVPDVGNTPDTNARYTGHFSAVVTWEPSHNPFQSGIGYKVNMELTPHANYVFAEGFTPTINGTSVYVDERSASLLKISHTFPIIGVTIIETITVITQPTKRSYTHGETLDLTGLVVRVTYNNQPTKDITSYADLADELITVSPSHGDLLTHVGNGGKPVVISRGLITDNTDNLTVAQRALTINSATAGKVYDGYNNATGVTITLTGMIDEDINEGISASSITSAYTGVNAGTNTISVTAVTLTSNNSGAADAAWRNYTVTVPATLSVAGITPRPVTITPNPGQGKVYNNAADHDLPVPALTFTPSTSIISPNTESGVLRRASGENVGDYAINLGTLSWGSNYTLSLSATPVNFTIRQATGSGINAYTLSATHNSITTSALSLTTATGQPIEYAYSMVNTLPTTGWTNLSGSTATISGLNQGTEYFVFVRAQNSTNYEAGTAVVRSIRTTTQLTNITINFNPNADIALTATPGNIVISRSANTQQTFTLEGAAYTSIQWKINGVPVTGATGSSFTLRGQDFNQFTPVNSQLYVEVVRGGITYNLTIPFRVNP